MPDLLHAPAETPVTADLLALSVTAPNGEVQQHVLAIGKNTIGSGQRCRIQLQGEGVLPLHCLITVEGDAATVTRWGPGAELNGNEFGSAALGAGDRLVIGGHTLALDGPKGRDIAERSVGEATATPVVPAATPAETNGNGEAPLAHSTTEEPPAGEASPPAPSAADSGTPPLAPPADPSQAVDWLRDLLQDPLEDEVIEDELQSLTSAEVEGLRSETQRLNDEVVILRRQLAEKSAEAAGASRDLAHAQSSLNDTQDALAQALTTAALDAEETKRLEEEFAQLRTEVQTTRDQVGEERAKTESLRTEITDARSEHVALTERLRSTEAARDAAEDKAAAQTRALNVALSEVVELKAQAEAEPEEEKRVRELEALNEKLEAGVKTAEAERDLLRREQDAVESHYSGLNDQIESLRTELESKDAQREQLEDKVSSLEAALRGSVEALEQANDEQSQRTVEETQVRRAADEARDQLQLTLDALAQEQRQMAEAQAEVDQQAERLATAERELTEARAELDARGTADPAQAEQLARLEETAEGLRDELRSTRERLEKETHQRQASVAEVERLSVERERAQEQLAELEQENRALRDESFGHQEQAREAVAEQNSLREELGRLGETVAELRSADEARSAATEQQADQEQRLVELERALAEKDEQLAALRDESESAAAEADAVGRLKQEVEKLSAAATDADRRACDASEELAAAQEALREREVSCAELEDARSCLAEQVEEMTQRLQAADWALEATEACSDLPEEGDAPAVAEAAEPETASEAADTEPEPSTEQALAEANDVEDPIADVFAAPAEEPVEEQEPFQPESFIDQYQHLLPGENEPVEPVPAAEDRRQAPRPAETADDDDSALEAYMENLMRRVRGESSEDVPPPIVPEKPESKPTQPIEVDTAAARLGSVDPPVDGLVEEQAMSIEEWASAARKSQPAVNLDAMRDLANSSARQAIATHSRQSIIESRVYQAIGCVILIGVGLYVLMSAPRITVPVMVSAGALFGGAGWLGWRVTQCVVRNRGPKAARLAEIDARD